MDREIKKILKPVLFILILIVFFSVTLYLLALFTGIPDVTFLKSFYMIIITLSTVGYGDVFNTQDSVLLTAFNTFAILTYMVAVAYAVSNFTAFLIEGRLKRYFQYKKNLKRVRKMQDHYIICGIRDIGVYVARELHETKRPFVVVDESLNAVEVLRKEIPDLIFIEGDATDDIVLLEAGIKKAKAMIASLDNDKENLYLVVAAKDLNKEVQIAAKFNNPKTRQKFLNAGASYLVSPNMIGGMRIASELIRPKVVSFLDIMLRSKKEDAIRVEEVVIPEDSSFIGKTIMELFDATGVMAVSYSIPGAEAYEYNPAPDQKIVANMILIFISTPEQRMLVEKKVLSG